MTADADLYDQDFVAWTHEQAARLRAAASSRVNLPIDWENVAEEIESLGNNTKRELESRLITIIEHLLKLRWSAARNPAAGWRSTVRRERRQLQSLLGQSPSLRWHVTGLVADGYRFAAGNVGDELVERSEISAADCARMQGETFSAEQVLGNWWPEAATDSGG